MFFKVSSDASGGVGKLDQGCAFGATNGAIGQGGRSLSLSAGQCEVSSGLAQLA